MWRASVVRHALWTLMLTFPLVQPGFAQAPPVGAAPTGSAPVADTVDLIFEREIFAYPSFQRRNPFRPLSGTDSGPRFEDLVLLGVIVSANRASSIATVGERPPGSNQEAPSRTHRLREGEVLGNTRVLEIRDQLIVVQVEDFGLFELRSLELRRVDPNLEPAPGPLQGPEPTAPPPAGTDQPTGAAQPPAGGADAPSGPDSALTDQRQNWSGGRL
jgi:hypothetical protein